VAADLLAQAEHDPDAQAVLATPDEKLAQAVAQQLELQLETLSTADTAGTSIQRNGCIIITKDFYIMSCNLIMKITIQYTQYFFTLNSNLFFKQAPTPIDSKIFVLYNYIKL
jgi:hypothetical protein